MAVNETAMQTYSALVESGNARVVNVIDAWSNGSVIRRYQGQDRSRYNYSTSTVNGYKRMVAILIEIPSEEESE